MSTSTNDDVMPGPEMVELEPTMEVDLAEPLGCGRFARDRACGGLG